MGEQPDGDDPDDASGADAPPDDSPTTDDEASPDAGANDEDDAGDAEADREDAPSEAEGGESGADRSDSRDEGSQGESTDDTTVDVDASDDDDSKVDSSIADDGSDDDPSTAERASPDDGVTMEEDGATTQGDGSTAEDDGSTVEDDDGATTDGAESNDDELLAHDYAPAGDAPDYYDGEADGDDSDADEGGSTADGTSAAGSDEEDEPASATAPVSTGDTGGTTPAGVGQPTPAGGGSGGGTTGGSSGTFPDFDEDMAPDDREQPLADHIEEMTHRLLVAALVMGLVAVVALLWSDDMINFLWYSFLGPNDGTCPGPQCPLQWRPHVYHPLSLVLARLKVAALVGFVAGLPVAVYQTYRFMRPGLYPHERRYYLAAVPTSLVLAVAGVGFAYFVVLPSLFIYFSAYSSQAAELAFALSDTFNLMVMMLGFFALIFQIPLLVMLAIMMGVTTRRWLEDRRIYFWTGFAGVAFFFSPDPTGMAPLIVAITMIALFEGTLLLLRWTERSVALFSAKTMEANRPYAWALAAVVGYVVSAAPVPEGYFDALPPAFVETLAGYGYVGFTPAIIAAGIVLVFELLGWIARRVGAGQSRRTGLRVRLAFIRARPFVWLLAIVVGYAGSPDPELLDVFRDVALPAPLSVAVVVGLIVAYEGLRFVLSYVRPE